MDKIKRFFSRVICFILRRHTCEFMKSHGGSFHQFYSVNGGGRQCVCPHCDKNVIIK